MRHSDNLLTFPRTLWLNHFSRDYLHRLLCLISAKKITKCLKNGEEPSLYLSSHLIEIKCMALMQWCTQKNMARQKEDARWCTQADAGSAERGGPAHRGGHHPNQEPSGCTSYFSNLQDVAKIWGGIVNCGGGHVIQVEDAGGVAKQLGGSSGWSWHTPADMQSFWSKDSSNHLKWVISPTDEMALQPYLIFVIFFTRAKFLENKIYTEKTRKLRQNTQ